MKDRDRLVLMGVVVVVLLVAGWMLVVKPENKRAADLATQIASAQTSVSTAQSQAASAAASKQRYSTAYAAMVNVGKAVPATNDVAALMYQLNHAANVHNVVFDSITASAANGTAAAATPGTATSAAGPATSFTALPFTLSFNGSFFDLYQLLNRLNRFVVAGPNGSLTVDGRLLTITSATLAVNSTGTPGSATAANGQLTGTITADAYVLPAAAAGSSTATPAAAPPGSSSPTTGSPTAPAVITPGR